MTGTVYHLVHTTVHAEVYLLISAFSCLARRACKGVERQGAQLAAKTQIKTPQSEAKLNAFIR